MSIREADAAEAGEPSADAGSLEGRLRPRPGFPTVHSR